MLERTIQQIKDNTSSSLAVVDTRIKEGDAKAMAEALKLNNTLVIVSFSTLEMGGVKALDAALMRDGSNILYAIYKEMSTATKRCLELRNIHVISVGLKWLQYKEHGTQITLDDLSELCKYRSAIKSKLIYNAENNIASCFDQDILGLCKRIDISKYMLIRSLPSLTDDVSKLIASDCYKNIIDCLGSIDVIKAKTDHDSGLKRKQKEEQRDANQVKYFAYAIATVVCAGIAIYLIRNPQVLKDICEKFIQQLPASVTEYLGR